SSPITTAARVTAPNWVAACRDSLARSDPALLWLRNGSGTISSPLCAPASTQPAITSTTIRCPGVRSARWMMKSLAQSTHISRICRIHQTVMSWSSEDKVIFLTLHPLLQQLPDAVEHDEIDRVALGSSSAHSFECNF